VGARTFAFGSASDASDLHSLVRVEGREFLLSFKSTAERGDGVFVSLGERTPSAVTPLRTLATFHGAGEPGSYEVYLVYFPSASGPGATRSLLGRVHPARNLSAGPRGRRARNVPPPARHSRALVVRRRGRRGVAPDATTGT
jgi:hypothetical protein